MKLNPRVFKNLNTEPFLEQDIDGQKVSFYDMNETQYLTQYAGRGKFAIWTSNGGDEYKVLIEKSYYEALEPFYSYDVNKIWLNFLTSASQITRKMSMWFLIPTMVIYLAVAAVATIYFPEQIIAVLLGLIVVIFGSNIIQTRLTSNRVKEANINAQNQIRETLGNEVFDGLVQAQEDHYKAYFKFEEEAQEDSEAQISVDAEVVEEDKDKE